MSFVSRCESMLNLHVDRHGQKALERGDKGCEHSKRQLRGHGTGSFVERHQFTNYLNEILLNCSFNLF